MKAELLFTTWVERLRREEPRAAAILCHGSYARGEAEAYSDLDLDVLIDDDEVEESYRSAFMQLSGGRLIHATIETMSLETWLEPFAETQEAEDWAFFLPVRQAALLLWATPKAQAQLEGNLTRTSALTPQLQDLIEGAAKVRNAFARNDDLGVRLAAYDMAIRCPALLALLSPPPPSESRRQALSAALELSVTPEHYRDDLLVCLGMSGHATSMHDVHNTALRLATNIIMLLRAHPAAVVGRVEPGLPEALADGRLLRLIRE